MDSAAGRRPAAEDISIDVCGPSQALENDKRIKEVSRSFTSDTITVPTEDMFAYASRSSLGDDVYHEPATDLLEQHIARITGKEAALFVPSGTMSNQIALRTHFTQPPHSLLCDARADIHRYEGGGAAYHSQALTIPVAPQNGHHLTAVEVEAQLVTGDDFHVAPTRVISLENTLKGTIIPQDEVLAIARIARRHDIKLHLDGARLWHAAAETGMTIAELAAPFDSVSICFSKGLGAPIGSCLAGSKQFITKARWFRKLFGGGMRQTGFLAASAAFAITHNFPKLRAVHDLARRLASGLRDVGVRILSAETCMVWYDPSPLGITYTELIDSAARLPDPITLFSERLVVHIQTNPRAVDDLLDLVRSMAKEKHEQVILREEYSEIGYQITYDYPAR